MSNQIDSVQKEREELTSAYQTLKESLEAAIETLDQYYGQAYDQLDAPSYIVNSRVFKQLQLHVSQLRKTMSDVQNGAQLFLISLSEKPSHQWQQMDIESYLNKYRQKTDIPLRKQQLEQRQLLRIKSRCVNATGLTLLSNTLDAAAIIQDGDIVKLKEFTKISRLSLRDSNVSEQALQMLARDGFENLKEIDISQCRFVGDSGLKWLSGYKYVSIKANRIEGVTYSGIINLVATSYNLNYLEISQLKGINYSDVIERINQIYSTNKLNFKWLQVICNLGTILFVNKLAYLTHLTNNDNITDREVQILLGDQPLLDGVYFNCCEDLHSATVQLLVRKCAKIKRLSLRWFANLTDALLGDLVSNLSKLQDLSLDNCCCITDKGVIQVANQLQKLKKISLSGCQSITSSSLLYLIEKMPTLVGLNVSHCKNITDDVIYKLCNCLPNFTSLNLTKCEQITNAAVAYVSEKLNHLQTLILNGCEGLNDRSLCPVAMRLRKISRLEIEWCGISQTCIDFIAENLNQLKILNLNYCPMLYDEAISSLAKRAVRLHSISLASCDKITAKGFVRLFDSIKKIENLDLRQCVGVNDVVLEKLCESSRGRLMQLDLSWCSTITDHGLLQLSQFQHQLLYLNLNGCANITDSGVAWLCTSLTKLEYLNLSFCENLTDESVKEISKNLVNLRILYLCELISLTDSSLSTLASVPNLEELHLSGCIKITSSSLIALLHNLQKLQCLNISSCSNIFAQSLLLLVERMRNLRKFFVGSLEVDDTFLSMIGEYMRRLQVLSLQYCRRISDQGVLKMVQRAGSLIHIDLHNTSLSQKTKKLIFEELGSRSVYGMMR